MNNNNDKNLDIENLKDSELEQVSGGDDEPAWGIRYGENGCCYQCFNPSCKHFGHYVKEVVGPPTGFGGYYHVCEFCSAIIINHMGGDPIPFE